MSGSLHHISALEGRFFQVPGGGQSNCERGGGNREARKLPSYRARNVNGGFLKRSHKHLARRVSTTGKLCACGVPTRIESSLSLDKSMTAQGGREMKSSGGLDVRLHQMENIDRTTTSNLLPSSRPPSKVVHGVSALRVYVRDERWHQAQIALGQVRAADDPFMQGTNTLPKEALDPHGTPNFTPNAGLREFLLFGSQHGP
ncbi:hypothetical protein B0J11DRAFT_593011 [Dendryphion nanum]|uniref:Uncharacterized protein n=1 Tax=Dendryphion nanum TaxID=256645 RepID=A0A9P9DCY8_9PLEO|nr:hypothetical protein B0J11DRAFT_593011 [Dendryphion nanum]